MTRRSSTRSESPRPRCVSRSGTRTLPARRSQTRSWRPRPTSAPSRYGTRGSTRTIRCWTTRVASTTRRSTARRRIRRRTARRNRAIRRRRCIPLTRTPDGFVQNSRQVTVYDPKTKQFSFIDTCFGTHHLNFGEDADHTLWLSNNLQNELALIGWVKTKQFWETQRRRQVAGLVAAHRGYQRQRQARRMGRAQSAGRTGEGQAHRARALRDRLQSARRVDLGLEHHPSRLGHSRAARRESVGNGAGGGLQSAGAGLRHARLRHRSQRHGMGDARERAHGELRSAQVQGTPERAGRDRGQPVSRRMDVLSAARAVVRRQGRRRGRARTTPGWINTTSWASARTRPSGPAISRIRSTRCSTGRSSSLRVPYPMGFFAKGVDGRIDDPRAGWKGRGLWVTSGNRTPMHIEGVDAPTPGAPGKTLSSPLVVHFQLRPDPLRASAFPPHLDCHLPLTGKIPPSPRGTRGSSRAPRKSAR